MTESFYGQCICTCDRRCAQNIDILQQKDIFTKYTSLNSWSSKVNFIRALVKTNPVKEGLNPIKQLKKRMNFSKIYVSDSNGIQHQVCLQFIVKLLHVNRTKIFRALTQTVDHRGKYPHRKANVSDVEFMKSFIRKFPTFPAHFDSTSSETSYLHPNLNFAKMYNLYEDHCTLFEKRISSKSFFRKILCGHFNCVFLKKHTNSQCSQCKEFKKKLKFKVLSNDFRERIEEQERTHIDIVTKVQGNFFETVTNAKEKVQVYTFQMCRPQQLPSLSVSETVFCRPLWFFNFLIYDEIKNDIYAYVWNETTATKGSEEISSCLFRHFTTHVPSDTKEIILFCNPTRGQNRNIKISLMLLKFISDAKLPQLECIEQRFFAPGHTYNSCDRSFTSIEKRKAEVGDIYTPEDWVDVISTSRKTQPKFHVVEMQKEHFYSSKTIENLLVSLKSSLDDKKIKWNSYQRIKYGHEQFTLKVMQYCGDESSYKDVLLKQKGLCDLTHTNLRQLCRHDRKISKQKYSDLQRLLNHIPQSHHEFYMKLKCSTSKTLKKDFALAIRQSDDEEEEEE